ncbi:hypothetical protein [Nocardia sp. BMG51109]|nr:hypothetical protein [Nocardia sp. BMG51109]
MGRSTGSGDRSLAAAPPPSIEVGDRGLVFGSVLLQCEQLDH